MKIFKTTSCLFSLLFLASKVEASPLKILFFYPGGQGNQEQAQPLLDSFAEGLNKASGGKIDAKIFYISDAEEGLQFIKTQKPQAAILGLETYYKYRKDWGVQVIAKTLQLPTGDGTDQFFLLSKNGNALPSSGNLQVTSPRPLGASFVSDKLFPQLKDLKIQIQASPNTVGELRAIGSGSKPGFVLLDQFEYNNISKLKTPWATALSVLAKSEKVSSAPFVVFPQNISPDTSLALQNALLQLGQDGAMKATLADLRLKGFKKAASTD